MLKVSTLINKNWSFGAECTDAIFFIIPRLLHVEECYVPVSFTSRLKFLYFVEYIVENIRIFILCIGPDAIKRIFICHCNHSVILHIQQICLRPIARQKLRRRNRGVSWKQTCGTCHKGNYATDTDKNMPFGQILSSILKSPPENSMSTRSSFRTLPDLVSLPLIRWRRQESKDTLMTEEPCYGHVYKADRANLNFEDLEFCNLSKIFLNHCTYSFLKGIVERSIGKRSIYP